MRRTVAFMLSSAAVIMGLTLGKYQFGVHDLVKTTNALTDLAFVPTDLEPITSENVGKLVPLARFSKGISKQALWSPDGKILAICSTAGIWFYDANVLGSSPELLNPPASCQNFAFSPDGSILASVGGEGDKSIHLWDVKEGRQKAVLEGHDDDLYHVAIGLNPGKTGAIVSALPYTLWPIKAATHDVIVSAGFSSLVSAFNPAGTLLALSNGDYAQIWNTQTGKVQATLAVVGITSLAFTRDGKYLATGSYDTTVRLWNAKSGGQITVLPHQSRVDSVALSPDGTTLAAGEDSGKISLWDIQKRKVKATLNGHTYWVTSVAFSLDGGTLLSAGFDETVRVWDLSTTKQSSAITGFTAGMRTLGFSSDSRQLGAGDQDGAVRIWDVEPGTIRNIYASGAYNSQIAFSPDGQTIAVYITDYEVQLRDLHNTSQSNKLMAHPFLTPLEFSPNGKVLASRGLPDEIQLWNLSTFEKVSISTGQPNSTGQPPPINSIAFSPDGKVLVAAGNENIIRVYDLGTNAQLAALNSQQYSISQVTFSHDGQILASVGGWPKLPSITLWDVQTWSPKRILTLDARSSSTIAFNLDDMVIAAGAYDGKIWLWNSRNGMLLKILRAHTQDVASIAFSPDGKLLASGSDDGTIRLWGVVRESELF